LLELERLVGVKPSTIQLPYLNQFPGLPATQSLIRQFVWENSQDLRILRKDIQVQEKVISSIYSRLYPTVSLNVEKDQSENVRGANASQTDTRAVGVMSWEFSLGGKDLYAAKLAKAELANRQSKLAEEEDRIMQGVDADFALLQSATLRISTGLAEQDAAMIVLNTLRQQMKTGRVGSMMEAMDANERYFNARQRLVQTLSQQMQAHAQLLRRLGTSIHPWLSSKAQKRTIP
jgi:outer membrane protein TolC